MAHRTTTLHAHHTKQSRPQCRGRAWKCLNPPQNISAQHVGVQTVQANMQAVRHTTEPKLRHSVPTHQRRPCVQATWQQFCRIIRVLKQLIKQQVTKTRCMRNMNHALMQATPMDTLLLMPLYTFVMWPHALHHTALAARAQKHLACVTSQCCRNAVGASLLWPAIAIVCTCNHCHPLVPESSTYM
jgi:hypothetical protein